MKYFLLLLLMLFGALAFFRLKDPQRWNQCMDAIGSLADRNSAEPQAGNGPLINNEAPAGSDAVALATVNATTSVEQPPVSSLSTTSPGNPSNTQPPGSLPSTITTLSGKTYTGCVLSKVTPDGISFTHSMGVSKVLFSDLDPGLAKDFGYDQVAAKKYEAEELARESKSDSERALVDSQAQFENNPANAAVPAPVPESPSGMTDEEREKIHAKLVALEQDAARLQMIHFQQTPEQGYEGTQGAYADKIAADEAQIAQLKQKFSRLSSARQTNDGI